MRPAEKLEAAYRSRDILRRRELVHARSSPRSERAFSISAAGGDLSGDEVEAWAAEQRELSERGDFFFACIQFCFAARKPGS